jgi:hypothetical protein
MKKQFLTFFIGLSLFNLLSAQIPHKVMICGVCRDVADRVPYSMRIMETIGNLFEDYRIIVYENNSKDATPRLLHDWQDRNPKVVALSEHIDKKTLEKIVINRLDDGHYYRPELISRARNIVLDRALSDSYKEFAYVIWIDMDFKLEPNYAGITEVFEATREWDAVFAYGTDPHHKFWDWYAFRDHRCPIGSELLGNAWWYLPKSLVLDSKSDWYPVYSAFGGCGIYKKDSIRDCQYSALVTEDLALFSQGVIEKYKHTNGIVQKYLKDTKNIKEYINLSHPSPQLPNITDPSIGFYTLNNHGIVWKMSSFVYKYPSVCEHVTFHASMIIRGHDKLFINPRLAFHYGDFITQ